MRRFGHYIARAWREEVGLRLMIYGLLGGNIARRISTDDPLSLYIQVFCFSVELAGLIKCLRRLRQTRRKAKLAWAEHLENQRHLEFWFGEFNRIRSECDTCYDLATRERLIDQMESILARIRKEMADRGVKTKP